MRLLLTATLLGFGATAAMADPWVVGSNLLANPGADSLNISGWTGVPSFTIRQAGPPPQSGAAYFFAGAGAQHSLIQTVDLLNAGISDESIDSGMLFVESGGYQRSFDQGTEDEGRIVVQFLDASLLALDTFTGPIKNNAAAWELTIDRRPLPPGSRFVRYTFTSTRHEGTNNDGYLDEAFVRIWDETCYADSVQRYDPLFGGGVPPDLELRDATRALGTDDYTDTNPAVTFVTLAQGGLLELGFTNNALTNSGDARADLYIFEIGPDVEDTSVAIRPTHATADLLGPGGDANDDGFYEIGQVAGSTSAVDLDAFFPGYPPGQIRFTAVQLIDDPNEGESGPPSGGADIDAVCALASAPASVPATSGYGMLGGALLLLVLGVRRLHQPASRSAV